MGRGVLRSSAGTDQWVPGVGALQVPASYYEAQSDPSVIFYSGNFQSHPECFTRILDFCPCPCHLWPYGAERPDKALKGLIRPLGAL